MRRGVAGGWRSGRAMSITSGGPGQFLSELNQSFSTFQAITMFVLAHIGKKENIHFFQ